MTSDRGAELADHSNAWPVDTDGVAEYVVAHGVARRHAVCGEGLAPFAQLAGG